MYRQVVEILIWQSEMLSFEREAVLHYLELRVI